MRLAPEGLPFILAFAVVAGAAWAAGAAGIGPPRALPAVSVVFGVLTLFSLWFFRNPTPDVPTDEHLVVAPGQGKVIIVGEADEPTYMGGRARKISIFLNVFDVHVQRAPVSGLVEHRVYKPGAYAVAWAEKASDINEQASLGIATPDGKVLVRQIAGLVARRIVTDPAVGDKVTRGARFGIIRFGSRVDLFLPLEWEVMTKVGDKVVVGVTALARRPGAAPDAPRPGDPDGADAASDTPPGEAAGR